MELFIKFLFSAFVFNNPFYIGDGDRKLLFNNSTEGTQI